MADGVEDTADGVADTAVGDGPYRLDADGPCVTDEEELPSIRDSSSLPIPRIGASQANCEGSAAVSSTLSPQPQAEV